MFTPPAVLRSRLHHGDTPRWSSRALFLMIALMASASSRRADGAALPARTGRSWQVVDRMWDAVQKNAQRKKLLFSDRYYTEDFYSGAPPLPWRAYLRRRVSLIQSGRHGRIVVNRQYLMPIQEAHPGYYGVEFREEELIFDTRWRLRRWRLWHWGRPAPRDLREPKVPGTLSYGGRAGGEGYREVRVEGGKAISSGAGERRREYPVDQAVPFQEAVELLLSVAADAAKGARLVCRLCPAGRTETYEVGRFEDFFGPPDGGPVDDIVVKKSLNDTIAYDRYRPWQDERSSSYNQCSLRYKPTTRAAYQQALRKFLKRFRITTLADRGGKPVRLPLGLKDLGRQ